ncbi:Inositol-1-monophosphatase OS=Tsukamurella paurometabola (strain ATCC 8368 / DSM / CCUG 35730/ CIP 100753 / JCM 10117 / KCTC 9821 / NBRC 16120 / NCIMB 702349 / NCTC 13040) OX=521096 GN=Tpau_1880 PE=3 SV=1 [Tsukamurella paurometabola]|uniref:Inositol-1-monophosphatase n=1 Tax=Tsukamurella paurometabola (strain ATCC 8368 / DSM 20162 / CCUG 35730 / CIP 100753 / JCM 10117 / KCTC 9821 / NBRC 16120 / NCIMB 702349 / NCTC 13040) TaxID=521096 RepID=D5UMZ6_TSUPD|nr:inositol monophosphatase family protein [Tsukamurella paurometabola]ADG78493.1 inositol monophosphatase [Tsukamurella paurometabola DSM 20162]SUP31897.1 Inositol-1-monophosphatase SuhB [Tsukamurella paurometabola]
MEDVEHDRQQLSEIAVAVVREAAQRVVRRRAEVFGANAFEADPEEAVSTKSTPTDPVTVVDTETEHFIRERLAQVRPDDTVLGEELGGRSGEPGTVRWIVDPIDGTVNFLYGVPAYAVSLGAQIDGVSVAGAVADVVQGSVYAAALGAGAREILADGTERTLRANPIVDPALALVATGFGYARERRERQGRVLAAVLPQVRDVRRIGSAALDLCMVAAGRADAHFEHGLSPWDWAAGSLIAAEAGATVIVPAPDSTSDQGALTLAAAPGIAEQLIEILRAAGGLENL